MSPNPDPQEVAVVTRYLEDGVLQQLSDGSRQAICESAAQQAIFALDSLRREDPSRLLERAEGALLGIASGHPKPRELANDTLRALAALRASKEGRDG